MMTTMATLFGALPIALSHGAGSELRRPLGIAIVGGLLVSQFLTLYTTPVIYLYLDRLGGERPPRATAGNHSGCSGVGAFLRLPLGAPQTPRPPYLLTFAACVTSAQHRTSDYIFLIFRHSSPLGPSP